VFGIFFAVFLYNSRHPHGQSAAVDRFGIFILSLNSICYPFVRYQYERAVGSIFKNHVFFVNAWLLLLCKYLSIMICHLLATPLLFFYAVLYTFAFLLGKLFGR
jgi:hypothetical protein